TRFCDRNVCADLYEKRQYGGECALRAPADGGVPWPPDRGCSAGLLCMEGRCRSCTSDEECQSYFGMGKCIRKPGGGPLVCSPHRRRPGPIVGPGSMPPR